MTVTLETRQYMQNCITRIYRAPCSVHCLHDRDRDIAEAVMVASIIGVEAAHRYLIQLCNNAENGKYTDQPATELRPEPSMKLPIVRVSKSGKVKVTFDS